MEAHEQRQALSYRNLDAARERAKKKSNYLYEKVREDLSFWVKEHFHHRAPHSWQLDVGESILLGLDTILIAPTGAGKSLPFIIPLAKHPNKTIIIISPLIALQDDMAAKFNAMGISSVAVNADNTKTSRLYKDIKQNKYRVILASPEMCLLDTAFRTLLSSEAFAPSILAYVVDEAHCISQWSGDFRKSYGHLDQLRAFVPVGVPILATTATLTKKTLAEVALSLKIEMPKAFFLNLGNDRPNISLSTRVFNSTSDFASLDFLIPADLDSVHTIKKTIIFTNTRQTAQDICRYLQTKVPPRYSRCIAYFQSLRSSLAKKIVLQKFRQGEIRILVVTEAAGMGADISDVQCVVQYGLAPSLTTWTQRAGRAGRDPNIQAEAIMLVEKSAFQKKAKRKPPNSKSKSKAQSTVPKELDNAEGVDEQLVTADGDLEEPQEPLNQCVEDNEDTVTYGKKVEAALRSYIDEEECLRNPNDDHYNYPRELRKPPTGICCDRHIVKKPTAPVQEETAALTAEAGPTSSGDISGPSTTNSENLSNDTAIVDSAVPANSTEVAPAASAVRPRPCTPPPQLETASVAGSPQQDKNSNGKRGMGPSTQATTSSTAKTFPKTRRDECRVSAIERMSAWRRATKSEKYGDMMFSDECLMPDSILRKIASDGTLRSLEDLTSKLSPPWIFAEEHAEEIFAILKDVDEEHRQTLATRQVENREKKKRQTEQRRQEEKRREDALRYSKDFFQMVQRQQHPTPGQVYAAPPFFTPLRTPSVPFANMSPIPGYSMPLPYPPPMYIPVTPQPMLQNHASPNIFYPNIPFVPSQTRANPSAPIVPGAEIDASPSITKAKSQRGGKKRPPFKAVN